VSAASAGVYVHIPFCRSKCPYCDFFSLPFDDGTADAYLLALLRAMEHPPGELPAADTLYLGGGTPSLMGARRLGRLAEAAARAFSLTADAELTLEANPGTVDTAGLRALRAAGFNRISLGVQSARNRELALLGRGHDAAGAARAVRAAHDAGFPHISADVMLGIPEQTPETLRDTLDTLAALPLDHISAYLLKAEPGTPFCEPALRTLCPGEDETAELYLACVARLESLGFAQYEISNFARPGGESRHNLKCWLCEPYLGLGPSAHSFVAGSRFSLPRDLAAFIGAKNPLSLAVDDGAGGDFEEYAMLRLRLTQGLDLGEAARLYREDAEPLLLRAKAVERAGLARIRGQTVSLTPQGFLLSNSVTAKLLYG